jgi:hypothetical protein
MPADCDRDWKNVSASLCWFFLLVISTSPINAKPSAKTSIPSIFVASHSDVWWCPANFWRQSADRARETGAAIMGALARRPTRPALRVARGPAAARECLDRAAHADLFALPSGGLRPPYRKSQPLPRRYVAEPSCRRCRTGAHCRLA